MIRISTLVFACVLCSVLSAFAQNVFIPDSNFKNYLLSQPSINRNGDGEIQVTEARQVISLDVSGKNIADLTGIREFTALRELQCNNNLLTTLDLQGITGLRLVYSTGNRLSSINIGSNNALQYLDLRRNQLAALDFGTNTKLYKANLENNLLTSLDVTAQRDLVELNCSHNKLTSLNVSNNPKLQQLLCAHNSIQSLDVSSNPFLFTLHVYNNSLTSLNLGSNANLNSLRCNHNQLTTLDVSSNTGLVELRAYVNRLSNLNLGTNTNLKELMAFQNELTALTTNGLSALRTLQVQFNKIGALDLKENRSLTTIDLRKNLLRTLDLRNGNNRSITSFDVTFNPPLTCVAVDDPAWSTANWPKHDYSAEYELSCGECDGIVYIPDANFRNALVTNYEINTNKDGVIQYCEAEKYTGIIKVNGLNIQDMTGIEAFPHISYLNCMDNQISRLILGTKDNLGAVDCPRNPLRTLDVSAAPSLNSLIAYSTQLSSVDVSHNLNLVNLDLHHVNVFSLDLSNNPKLKMLNIYTDPITSLDLSNNPLLEELYISSTAIKEIDLTHNPELGILSANSLYMSDIDLSVNTKLYDVDLRSNEIPFLDFSNHPRLERLLAGENTSLTKMNMKGVNILDFGEFSTKMADNLVCIEVDNVEDAERVWRDDVEPITAFSTDCSTYQSQIVYIPDARFKAALVGNPNINTNGDGAIQFKEAEAYTGSITVPNRDIADLTGIEAFLNIIELICYENQIDGELDLRSNTKLVNVEAGDNQIESVNVTGLTSLLILNVNHNRISTIDVSTNTNLDGLNCNYNLLTSVDVSANHELSWLVCTNNQISDIRLVPSLQFLEIGQNQVEEIDLTQAPSIEIINLNNNKLTSLNTAMLTKLYNAEMEGNQFTDLDFSYCPRLEVLNVRNNPPLSALNMRNINYADFNSFAAQNNPNLYCIEVDDPEMAQQTMGYGLDPHTQFSSDCGYDDVVYIPDPNFKAALVNNPDINANGDDEIQVDEAENYPGNINVPGLGIRDMTGLEAFKVISGLLCQNNEITRLDLSGNPELLHADCRHNLITEIIWPDAVPMYFFYGDYNQMTEFNMPSISALSVSVSHNQLTSFHASGGEIGLVDVSYNNLTSWDASFYAGANVLRADFNQLTEIILPPADNLSELSLSNNKLTSLDVSDRGYPFSMFFIENNELTSLNIATSDLREFKAKGNPGLSCIEVYDLEYAEANWRDDVDPGIEFSLDCEGSSAGRLAAWPNPSSGKVHIDSPEPVGTVQIFDSAGGMVTSQSGADLDISSLQPGPYYLRVQQGDNVEMVRVIKE